MLVCRLVICLALWMYMRGRLEKKHNYIRYDITRYFDNQTSLLKGQHVTDYVCPLPLPGTVHVLHYV